jgi:hypothetical protein
MALYGAETWTLRAADQKYLESFEKNLEYVHKIIFEIISTPKLKAIIPTNGIVRYLRQHKLECLPLQPTMSKHVAACIAKQNVQLPLKLVVFDCTF